MCECVVEHRGNKGDNTRGKKLGYALPLSTEYQSVENFKKYKVTECPLHANQECI